MILVGGKPVGDFGSAGLEQDSVNLENLIISLLEHPVLVESANNLKEAPLQIIKPPYPSGNEDDFKETVSVDAIDCTTDSKVVYIFQKEFATVSPLFAELVGTDEITTCIGLVMRDPSSGLTSVGHFDTKECVITGVNQLLASVISVGSSVLQVHMVGAFDDTNDHNEAALAMLLKSNSENSLESDDLNLDPGWSWPLALRMIDTLQNSSHTFEMETCCILQQNTTTGPNGHTLPIVRGLVVETSSGRLMPARFEPDARCPDGTVRGVRASTVSSNADWQPSLLSPYETLSDMFVISPFQWSRVFERYASYMLTLDDSKLLETFSTAPHAESVDFLPASREIFCYLQNFPDWQQTFMNNQARVFTRTRCGGWTRT